VTGWGELGSGTIDEKNQYARKTEVMTGEKKIRGGAYLVVNEAV
jgi:hypothetical protein